MSGPETVIISCRRVARLEETIEEFEGKSTLLNELIGLAWKALIHLYEKDDFFSVSGLQRCRP